MAYKSLVYSLTLSLLCGTAFAGQVCLNSIRGIAHGVIKDINGKTLRYVPYSGKGVILDTNVADSISSMRGKELKDYEVRRISVLRHLEKTARRKGEKFYYWIPDTVASEVTKGVEDLSSVGFPEASRRIRPIFSRESNEYKSVVAYLVDKNVGGGDGKNDRTIIADILLGEKVDGAVPTFVTADKGVFKPLCRLNPKCSESIDKNKFWTEQKDGFVAHVPGPGKVPLFIRIIPLQ
jgi:hypothetical protein